MPAEMLRRRPDVRVAEMQLAAQSALIGVSVADLYPSIALLGSLAFLAAAIYSDTKNSLLAIALVAASWPVHWLLRKGHAGSK